MTTLYSYKTLQQRTRRLIRWVYRPYGGHHSPYDHSLSPDELFQDSPELFDEPLRSSELFSPSYLTSLMPYHPPPSVTDKTEKEEVLKD